MRQCHALKSVVAFLPLPITVGNFVRIFCHLHQICVELFTLPHFVLSFPMKTIISSVHFIAAIIIQCSVFGTLRVTFSWFHIIAVIFCLVIIRQYHCTNTLGILCNTWV